jgi:hypothetical protein
VERVEEIASVLPQGAEEKRPLVERLHGRLALLERALPDHAPAPPDQLRKQLAPLLAAANPEPPSWNDLPPGLVHRFVGPSGKHLLKVYCKGDIWQPGAMERFVGELRSVDPAVTGNPVQIYEASRQMKRSYEQAAVYALAAIVVLVLIDLGSFGCTFLALLPLGAGMVQLFGLMGLLEIPLNPANMIVLPLILGIGVDYGIHVVHDFLHRRDDYQSVSGSTATALVINSLTTMVGFGSLMIATHQGLQSLGRVLTIGITCCLMSALIVPCLILLGKRSRRGEAARNTERVGNPGEGSDWEPSVARMPIRRREQGSLP